MMTMFQKFSSAVGLLLGVTSFAFAGDHNYGPYPAYYSAECGSCHVPYPPQLMTQAGWETQIKQLKQHYGTDASIDTPAVQTVLSYLVVNSAWKSNRAPTEATARLTKTAWFAKEHGANPPKGQTFSNCAACHTLAEKGDYSESGIKTPTGWRRDR